MSIIIMYFMKVGEKVYKILEIANLISGEIIGNKTLEVSKIAPFDLALEGEITFASDEKFLKRLSETNASVVIVPPLENFPEGKTYIKVEKNPREVLVILLEYFKKKTKSIEKSIEESSKIASDVNIPPNCYIGHDVEIGEGTILYPNSVILEGAKIGKNCIIYPNVTIREFCILGDNVILQPGAVIGSDGFGYSTIKGKHYKMEQIGNVIIESDVEIGANASIDRGAIGDTIIRSGTKIDNLVHIAHNDIIGKDCLIVAQVGMAGSVEIGNNVVIAGQVGIAGHLKIGDNVIIAAKSGVTNDVPSNSRVSGFPLSEHKEDLRIKVAMTKLPELVKKVKEIEKKLGGEKK